jgi:hypothetical protein
VLPDAGEVGGAAEEKDSDEREEGWASGDRCRGRGDLAEQMFKLILSICSSRCSSLRRAILEHWRHSSLVGLASPG